MPIRPASLKVLALCVAAATATAACVTAPSPTQYRAPQPVRGVDAARLYDGLWLEIGRPQLSFTDDCVAGTTTYRLEAPDRLRLRDTCQADTPQGKEKALTASATILDPGTNTRFRVRYFWGAVTWEYWILDHDDDYRWFISSDPTFERVWIYTREAPDAAELERLKARVAALGFDPERLQYPPALPADVIAATAARLP